MDRMTQLCRARSRAQRRYHRRADSVWWFWRFYKKLWWRNPRAGTYLSATALAKGGYPGPLPPQPREYVEPVLERVVKRRVYFDTLLALEDDAQLLLVRLDRAISDEIRRKQVRAAG